MISDFQANFTAIIETSSRSRIDRCPKNSACLRLRVIACQLACLDEGAACFVSKAQSRSCAWQCWLVPLWCWASCVLVSVTRCDRHFPEPSAVGATCWPRRVVYHSRLRVYEPLFARAQCSKVVGTSAPMVGDPLAALHRLPRYPQTPCWAGTLAAAAPQIPHCTHAGCLRSCLLISVWTRRRCARILTASHSW